MSINIITRIANVRTPQRSTEHSAGYDVFSDKRFIIPAGADISIALTSGINFDTNKYKALIFLRSSIGIKKDIRLVLNNEIVPFLELKSEVPNLVQTITLRNVGEKDFEIEQNMHVFQCIVIDRDEAYLPFYPEKVIDLQGSIPISLSLKEIEKGYQLILKETIIIPKDQRVVLPSGLKFRIKLDSFLAGFIPENEKRFSCSNGVPIIDSDYILASNEGHCFFSLDNRTDDDLLLLPGTALIDLISIPFYKADNEIVPQQKRTGGIGSTS